VIICGDFNSPPHTLPYQLLCRTHLDDDILDTLRRSCKFTDQVIVSPRRLHCLLQQLLYNDAWR